MKIALLLARIEALVQLVSELRLRNGQLAAENRRLREHIRTQGFRGEFMFSTNN